MIKRYFLGWFLAVFAVIGFSCTVFGGEVITRGEVCDMLITAADDYNPDVKKEDILKGYGNGDLEEERSVTRAEALVMLDRAFGGMPELGENSKRMVAEEEFEDIPQWAGDELWDVINAGIAAGTEEGKFSPNENVTREQMEKFIERTFAVFGTNPKDDFYAAANKAALDSSVIGEGKSQTGTFVELADRVNAQINGLINEIIAGNPDKGSREYKIKAMYENILDWENREAQGYEPIRKYVEAADRIEDMEGLAEFNQLIYDELGIGVLFFSVGIDSEDSSRYVTTFEFPTATFDREVYNGGNEKVRKAYQRYIASLLLLCGEGAVDANRHSDDILEFEGILAECGNEDTGIEDYFKEYSLEEIDRIFVQTDISRVFEGSGLKGKERIVADNPECMAAVGKMFTNDNIEVVREYAKVIVIDSFAEYFGSDFINAINAFIDEVYGTSGETSVTYGATADVMSYLGDYVGELYADRYCNEEDVLEVTGIVEEVISAYKSRLEKTERMSEQTKAEAIKKLDSLGVKVGRPQKSSGYLDGAVIRSGSEGGSYFDNVVEILLARKRYMLGLEGTEVDRQEWVMYPHTVNAGYSLQTNDITIPAAFLQKPLYSSDFSYEEKLGTIGFIIGHEISHAFDDSGCSFDEKGNLRNWWTEEDYAGFEEMCREVIEFYSGSEYATGIVIDPELTLGENIADLGAMVCITEIGSSHSGFDFKKMFESYGRMWYSASTRESLERDAAEDVHSGANVRVNKVLQNSDVFAQVYELTPEDGMYVPKNERVVVW